MGLLKLAVSTRRWDLAAHVIILAGVRSLQAGGKREKAGKKKEKARTAGNT